MAVLETLRNKFGLAITILVALGLLSFIIDPSSLETAVQAMSSKYDVGKIDGKSISYNDFQAEVEHFTNINEIVTGSSAQTSQQQKNIQNMAWQSMIDRYLFLKNARAAGINVGEEEMVALTYGDMVSPIISQDGVFADENGSFSKDRVLQIVQNVGNDATVATYWDYVQNTVYTQQFYSKYGSLFNASNFDNALMRRRTIADNNNTTDVDFVMVPLNPYAVDSTVTVTSSEIKDYYNSHKSFFRQQESRDIEYVVFEVKPSESDLSAGSASFSGLYDEFSTTDNVKNFLQKNSDRAYSEYWYKSGELSTVNADVNSFVFGDGNGEVSPIYQDGNVLYAARVMDTKMIPDSVYVKHILLQTNASVADSLLNVIRKGGDFSAIAAAYSDDQRSAADGVLGNIGWMTATYIIPGFEPTFQSKVGEPFILTTQYGTHIVEVERATKPVQKKQVAIFEKETLASKETFNDFYSTANQFATLASKGYDAYKAAADSMHVYSHPLNNVPESNENYGAIGEAKEVTRWIYDNKPGKVSGIITVNNNYFFVATLKGIHNEGYATVEEVAPQIKLQLSSEKMAQKKAEEVAGKIKGLTSMEAIAEALNTTVSSQTGVTFASMTGQGLDPKFIGAVSVAPVGQISGPVAGTIGTYVFEVKAHDTGSFYTEDDAQAYSTRVNSYMDQMLLSVMQQDGEVSDHRARFY